MPGQPLYEPANPQPLVPQDAASLVLVDRNGPEPRILMGRRHPDLAFMANKFVFPGGRVDSHDLTAEGHGDLSTATIQKLMIAMGGTPSIARARALGIAAIRETAEETGLILGSADNKPMAALAFFARAITPPDRSRRYDTRFFMADAGLASVQTLGGDGELVDLGWFTLDDARTLDLPGITRRIIDDIAAHLGYDAAIPRAVPFYYELHGRFRRDEL